MKKIIFTLFALLGIYQVQAQCTGRFHDEVFTSVTKDSVVYGSATNAGGTVQNLDMDIYQPAGDTMMARPVIVFIHGGTFVSGTKNDFDMVQFCTAFAKRGFVCATINYRLGLDAFPPNKDIVLRSVIRAVQDGKASIRYFRANASTWKIDTTKIFVGGTSAGAITALHIGYLTDATEFGQAGNVNDLQTLGGMEGGNNGSPGYSSAVHGVINGCGALGLKTWIAPGDIPLISIHGTDDTVVPYKTAQITFSGLPLGLTVDGSFVLDSFCTANNVSSRLYTCYGQGHVPYQNAAYMDTTIQFIADGVCPWAKGQTTAREVKFNASQIQIYPNPAQNNFTVKSELNQILTVELYNMNGALVSKNEGFNQVSVNRNQLSNGLYTVKVSVQDKVYSYKVIFE